ncbi:MAG: PEP-CTERM sorting domain-containing protein [Burkholderiales bacterium]|nr:PEP-CTERM sorting domain-containing protein [Burkholderiales bacterium]
MSTMFRVAITACLLTLGGIAGAQTNSNCVPAGQVSSSSAQACVNQVSEPGSLPLLLLGAAGAIAVARFIKRR